MAARMPATPAPITKKSGFIRCCQHNRGLCTLESMGIALNRPTAPIGAANAVLRGQARRHSVQDFAGPLSIKSVTQGSVAWKTGGRELVVDRGGFLVLNHGEPYSMEIDSRDPVSTLCVFFTPGFVETVCASIASDDLEPAPAPQYFLQ